MARILLHYDIEDDEYRELVRITLTEQSSPRFREVSKSVYEAYVSMLPKDFAGLGERMTEAFCNAPAGTFVQIEYPDTAGDAPDIRSKIIIDTRKKE
jgi:hypothetical protein